MQFVRRDAVTVARNKPKRRQPLVESDRRVLKDRADLGRKLPFAVAAVPAAILCEVRDGGRAATHTGARDAVRPAVLNEEVVRDLRVRELSHRLQHRLGNRLLVHALILPGTCLVCQVYHNPSHDVVGRRIHARALTGEHARTGNDLDQARTRRKNTPPRSGVAPSFPG